ncbi:hypothetical protein ABT224_01820 [Streptomyces sp. NPDC001584]|uniref:hypothetical protein n=1 Tax=Streptomyces sp. NPDC001584 TaxID=3154521 RepID=UPI00331D32A4
MLLTARRTALYDALLALTPYFDPAVREAAYRAAPQDVTPAPELRAPSLVPLSLALASPAVQNVRAYDRAHIEGSPS